MKPNIVLIHSDQHRYDCVAANGHPFLKTPNMDRLAREGANFSHAFTTCPICSPARASLLNGAWSTQHRCMSIPNTEMYRPVAQGFTTFSELLNTAGYKLGYVGKYHNEYAENPEALGFHEFVSDAKYAAYRKSIGREARPKNAGWFGETDPFITPEESRIAWGAGHAIRMIRSYQSEGKPFLVRWDPVEPHLANVVPEPYASMYPVSSIPQWKNFPDPLEKKPYMQAQQRRTWALDKYTWADWQPIVSRYLGEISLIDHNIGRILGVLDELGIAENTIVIYTTDHGDLCGSHGMIDKHFMMYEEVLRVPLMIRFPKTVQAGTICDAFVAHEIDIAKTICDAAGVTAPPTFAGKNLFDVISKKDPSPREDIFSQYHGCQFSSFTERMLRTREWKYVWNASAEDELYDLRTDSAELHNLAQDPPSREVLSDMRRRLVRWMEDVKDVMLNPWTKRSLLENLKV